MSMPGAVTLLVPVGKPFVSTYREPFTRAANFKLQNPVSFPFGE